MMQCEFPGRSSVPHTKSDEVTVLVPTCNHESYITEAIESIAKQTIFAECRVIVSDDCSGDGTFDVARSVCEKFPNVEVRRNAHNLGVMPHYRCLADLVETSYVAILEGDDVWIEPSKLEMQRTMLASNAGASFCFSACIVDYESEHKRVVQPSWNAGRNRLLGSIDLIYENPVATFSNCFYHSKLFKESMKMPPVLDGYDWLLNFRMSRLGAVLFLALPATLYRVHRHGSWSRMSRHAQRKLIRENLESFGAEQPSAYGIYIADALSIA
jgi:glycosyltransferase involved in cell wall biosynthesis